MTLRGYQKAKRLSDIEVAQLFGVARSTVSKWKAGHAFPHPAMIIHIAAVTEGRVQFRDWYGPQIREEKLAFQRRREQDAERPAP